MLIVPDLTDDGATVVGAVLAGGGGVVLGTTASNIGGGAILLGQLALNVGQCVLGCVGWGDIDFVQPLPGRETAVVFDCGLVELDDLLVLDIVGAVAGDVEGRVASVVLGEFVGPEGLVGGALVDPVRVHVVKQVVAAEIGDESIHAGALVRGDNGTIGEAVGGVR